MAWMAWTLPTAVFFVCVAFSLIVMTTAEVLKPSVSRRGFLPLVTSRGDRFFISLLASGFAHVGWLGFTELPVYFATLACLAGGFILMRWG